MDDPHKKARTPKIAKKRAKKLKIELPFEKAVAGLLAVPFTKGKFQGRKK